MKVIAYVHVQWNDEDLKLLQVRRGDPQGQARVEACTLLIALSTWRQILFRAQGLLAVRGHALGVLQDVIKLKARDPILNDITGENALVLAPQGGDIRAAHVWSEKKETCDRLSR